MTLAGAAAAAVPPPVVVLVRSPALVAPLATGKSVVPPIGIAYLLASLDAAGIDAIAIDAPGEDLDRLDRLDYTDLRAVGLSPAEIAERVPAHADIVGLSCMFSSGWPCDHRVIRAIRARHPHVRIVAGGEHVTACADYVLATCADVDACVLGEGEETIVELVRALRRGDDLAGVAGIAWRRDGVVVQNARRGRIRAVDDIPQPRWDGVPLENYLARGIAHGVTGGRSMPILASRGCPFQCTFCSSPNMWTTRWVAREPRRVVDEMALHVARHGVTNFDFYDLTAIVRRDWILAFCDELERRGLGVTFQLPSGTRSEALDDEVLGRMRRAGCHAISYAPESGSPATLAAIRKRVKLPRMERSIRAAVRHGMKVMVNIVVFPRDDWRSLRETFAFMLRFAVAGVHDTTLVAYCAYPGAELYDELRRQGRLPPLSDAYFLSLNYSNLLAANTLNERLPPGVFLCVRLGYLGLFYGVQFLCRPLRLWQAVRNIARNETTTRTEDTLRRLLVRAARLRGAGRAS
jgi:radical SAM superfamily enzyme YgiQ (UPF0313 family)